MYGVTSEWCGIAFGMGLIGGGLSQEILDQQPSVNIYLKYY